MLLARRRLEQQEKERAQARAEAAKQTAAASAVPSPPPPVEEKKAPAPAPAPRPAKGLKKADLAEFAKEHFGVELDPDAFKADELLDEVHRIADEADAKASGD